MAATAPDAPSSLELRTGERYFRINGKPGFVLGRNPVGVSPEAFDEHFKNAAAAGERFMRIHVAHMPPDEKAGEVHPDMVKSLDHLLESAQNWGLAVLPVLGVWADWNDGSQGETWHRWNENAFNAANGGPAKEPGELLGDTPCREKWSRRITFSVKRWGKHRNIVGWELFSEIDLITGSNEDRAVDFTKHAAEVVHHVDPLKRPITISQGGINDWPNLARSDAVDFVRVHPYAAGRFRGDLDGMILRVVRQRLQQYGKPVLIGECGLDWRPPRGTLDVAPRAHVGIRHAIWASVVSGAMSGRMLWWQDGYDQFEEADLLKHYQGIAVSAVAFVKDVDYSGFAPIRCMPSTNLTGATLGSRRQVLGWFRDTKCTAPEWPMRPLGDESVAIDVDFSMWSVWYVDPLSGKTIETRRVASEDGWLRLRLPDFEGSIAFRALAEW